MVQKKPISCEDTSASKKGYWTLVQVQEYADCAILLLRTPQQRRPLLFSECREESVKYAGNFRVLGQWSPCVN